MSNTQWVGTSTHYLRPGEGDAWAKEAAATQRTGTQRITFAGETAAPDPAADAFNLAADAKVVARQRLILLDDHPVELVNSYWPIEIARGTPLAERRRIRGGAVSLLAEMGYEAGSVSEQVWTRPPSREEAAALGTREHEWVLVLERTISDANGSPYEVSVMVSPGRAVRLNYSMKVG